MLVAELEPARPDRRQDSGRIAPVCRLCIRLVGGLRRAICMLPTGRLASWLRLSSGLAREKNVWSDISRFPLPDVPDEPCQIGSLGAG